MPTMNALARSDQTRTAATIVVLALHHGVIQDTFQEAVVGEWTAITPPFEPTDFRLAPALHHVDEEPVRGLDVRRVGRDLNPQQLLVQLDELAPDGQGASGSFGVDSTATVSRGSSSPA